MANTSPWSVKGVAPEAREAAKIAARRQGVNVGRWLSQTILAAASEELRSKRGSDDGRQQAPGGSASFSFTGQPAEGNSAPPPQQQPQQQQPQQPPPQPQQQPPQQPQYQPQYQPPPQQHAPGPGGPPALTPEAVLASIQKLANRIEESEQRTSEILQPIADRVGDLSEQIDEIKSKSNGSSAPVERAMMRLSERLDRMEEPGNSSGGRPSKTSSKSGVMGKLFGRD